MWYTRAEQALVIGAFYSMNGFQQCVGGLIGYGISQIHGQSLKNWQILFTVRPSCALTEHVLYFSPCSYWGASPSSGDCSFCGGSLTAQCGPHAGHVRLGTLLSRSALPIFFVPAEDRLLIAERVRKNETGIQNREFKRYQAWEGARLNETSI